MNIKIPYGLKEKNLIHISQIPKEERGDKCKCICPSCENKLQACKGDVREDYFRHSNNENCEGALESTLHTLAKKLVKDKKKIILPINYSNKIINFKEVIIEKFISKFGFQPDIIGITDNDERIIIEIKYTHECDQDKIDKLTKSGIPSFEINILNDEFKKISSDDFKDYENHIKKYLFENTSETKRISFSINELLDLIKSLRKEISTLNNKNMELYNLNESYLTKLNSAQKEFNRQSKTIRDLEVDNNNLKQENSNLNKKLLKEKPSEEIIPNLPDEIDLKIWQEAYLKTKYAGDWLFCKEEIEEIIKCGYTPKKFIELCEKHNKS